ncbi:hypothetical protein COBT_002124 [Conglomerata obtusa]
MKAVLANQINLFSLEKNNTLRCYTDFQIEIKESELKVNAHGIDISEIVIFIQDKSQKLSYRIENNDEIIEKSKMNFDDSLYENMKKHLPNLIIEVGNFTGRCNIRIIYKPKTSNSFVYTYKSDEHNEISCQPFFPTLDGQNIVIETIYAHSEELSVFAPGTQTKKDIRFNKTISSFCTELCNYLPFTIGTFKLIDIIQENIKIQILLPQKFIFDNQMRQDLLNMFNFVLEFLVRDEINVKIIYTYNNVTTFSENTIFLPISMFPAEGIDQNIVIRETITSLVSKMFYVGNKCSEFWLFISLREYFKNCIIRHSFGENEIFYRNKEDLNYIIENDIYEPALIKEDKTSFFNEHLHFCHKKLENSKKFKKIKGRLFFQILENHLTKAFLQKIMHEISKLERITTIGFIKIIKDITGKDMKGLFDYYVYRPGIMVVNVTYEIDRKGKVDVFLKQKSSSLLKNCNKNYFGELKIKIKDHEGFFEHRFTNGKINFQCHLKSRKKKVEKENEGEEVTNKEEVAEPVENTNPLFYMRVDPNFEHIISTNLAQPDFMYIEQLLTEKSVISQFEAIKALKFKPSENTAIALEKILNDPHIFYKIHILILETLSDIKIDESYVDTNNEPEDKFNFGFQRIINYFSKKYFMPVSTIPKPINSNFFTSFLVQSNISKTLINAHPELQKNYKGRLVKTKSIISAFLLNILKYNCTEEKSFYNNSFNLLYNQNNISNTNYLAGIIASLSYQICSKTYIDISPFITELERRRIDDIVFPSYQNLITANILRCYGRMCFYGLVKIDNRIIKHYTLDKNFVSVREAAFEVLITCFLVESFHYIKKCLIIEERPIKAFILNCIKSIVDINDEHFYKSEEYTTLFNDINICNNNHQTKLSYEQKYNILFKEKIYFYNLLRFFYYDDLLMEYITDIIYAIEGKFRRVSFSHETDNNHVENYVTKIKVNNLVKLKIDQKIGKDIQKDIKSIAKDNKDSYKNNKHKEITRVEEKMSISDQSPFLVHLKRCDIIFLCYDDFIYKYYKNIDEFTKKIEEKINEINDLNFNYKKIEDNDLHLNDSSNLVHRKKNPIINTDLALRKDPDFNQKDINHGKKIDQNNKKNENKKLDKINESIESLNNKETIVDVKNSKFQNLSCQNIISKSNKNSLNKINIDTSKKENKIKKIYAAVSNKLGWYQNKFDFDKFLIFVTNKYIKRHKYAQRLNIVMNEKNSFTEYIKDLHTQFMVYYVSQKFGSQFYLHAKALENVLNSLVLDFVPFEPLIIMSNEFSVICKNVFEFITTQDGIEPFKTPVKFHDLGLDNYIDIIRVPMDLESIEYKMKNNKYHSFDTFVKDMERIFLNCMEFNAMGSVLHEKSKILLFIVREKILSELNELIFLYNKIYIDKDELTKCTSMLEIPLLRDILSNYKSTDFALEIIKEILINLKNQKEAAQYIDDPSAEVQKIIKKPMCINKMIEKAENKIYITIGHVFNDMNQIVKNCIAMNGNSTWVVRVCKKMESCFKKEMCYAFSLRNLNMIKNVENSLK